MKLKRLAAILGLLIPLAGSSPASGGDFDLPGFINSELKAGKTQVVIPPGRYRVTPVHGRHLSFKNLSNIDIVAEGVEMVCTQTVEALEIEDCHHFHLKGLTIDYDPLCYTEAKITALAPDKSWVEFQILGGYPETGLEERIEIYDPATTELRRTDSGWEKEFDSLGDHRYRAHKGKHYRYRENIDTEQVGDILVTNNCYPPHAAAHAVVCGRSVGVKLEDVTVYASPSFGFLEYSCDGSEYLHCKVDRRKADDDPVKRELPRMRSLDADAFHSTEAVKGPAIIGCTAKFQGDDCVNIHGTYDLITACSGDTVRIAVLGRMKIEANDPVEFLPYSGKRPGDAIATKIAADSPLTAEELAFVQKLDLHPDSKHRLLSGDAHVYRITLDRAVDLPVGSAICSGNRVGNGFVVKDCDFGFNRSRGILIKASRGEVTHNTITHGWMAAVLVSPEFWWFEAASSSDVKIADNTIVGCRRAAIEVVAPGGNGKPLPSGAHRNITISGNIIKDSPWPNLRITSTDGLVIENNELAATDPTKFTPPLAETWRWGKNTPKAILLEDCDNPTIVEKK